VIDLSLDRVSTLLDRLGRPQDALPPAIHVAGTNGKGSVVAFMRAILEAAGLRVHVYTSPHLVRFHERIVVSGKEIEEATLIDALEECEIANRGDAITFFEVTTAAAFLTFAKTPADVALIETGLGGRLDATNLIQRPAATILTPISLDHQSFLGETLAEIAGEKAGILKPGVTCTSASQASEAAEVIRRRALALDVPLYFQDDWWHVAAAGSGRDFFEYRDACGALTIPQPVLAGGHQLTNAGLAVAGLRAADIPDIDSECIFKGVRSAHWPGRLQRLDIVGDLVDVVPPDTEVWLDGGHNPAAGEALAAFFGSLDKRPLLLIVGMLNTKDTGQFLARLAPLALKTVCVPVPGTSEGVPPDDLVAVARSYGLSATVADDVLGALYQFRVSSVSNHRILICGSLYLAGSVLGELVGTSP
jgi:dihydrofolate synthase/folylpolyglutamate synthase